MAKGIIGHRAQESAPLENISHPLSITPKAMSCGNSEICLSASHRFEAGLHYKIPINHLYRAMD